MLFLPERGLTLGRGTPKSYWKPLIRLMEKFQLLEQEQSTSEATLTQKADSLGADAFLLVAPTIK